MSDTRSQLAEVDALIAAAPDDPALQQLREDLLQLITLEEQESAGHDAPASSAAETSGGEAAGPSAENASQINIGAGAFELSEEKSSSYTAQGTFMEHVVSKEAVAEAPDLGAFQPVVSLAKSASKSQPLMKSGDAAGPEARSGGNLKDDSSNADGSTATEPPAKKKKKKKKKSDDAVLSAKFELPSHLVPLESDTPAQKLKKQRTAKALKSKFRAKQKEAEHSKRQNDWKSFASKAGGKRKTGVVGGSGSIFSTEEGVNARVGVISGGGGRKMTDFADPNKRYKFS